MQACIKILSVVRHPLVTRKYYTSRYTQTGAAVTSGHYQGQPQYQVHQPQQQYIVDPTGIMVGGINVSETSTIASNPAAAPYNNSHILRYTHQPTPNRR